ncbi:MAG: ChaN family lipoprotein [Burkholderiaceae bacterium]
MPTTAALPAQRASAAPTSLRGRCAARLPGLVLAALLAACAAPGGPPADGAAAQRLAAAMRGRSVVLLGEVHDNAAQHALRAQALRLFLAGGARPALLLEIFDRERQGEIDRALAAPHADVEAAVEAVIAAGTGGMAGSGWDWRFYRPYLALAVEHRLPLVAVNVSRADARRVASDGLASLGFDPLLPPDLQAGQAAAIVEGHCGAIGLSGARPLVAAQAARDQFMARALQGHADRGGALLLAGNGHVRRDLGVARWLPPSLRERSFAVGLLEPGTARVPAGAYDLVVETAAQARPDPCLAFGRAAPDRP